ncbi:hypothetical protein L208DRAFT_1201489, partial [Tricholoma matsutake]
WDHAIELMLGSNSMNCKVYPLAPNKQAELDEFIHPSKSPMASPMFFIKKKDVTLHLMQDYCVLNALMIKN